MDPFTRPHFYHPAVNKQNALINCLARGLETVFEAAAATGFCKKGHARPGKGKQDRASKTEQPANCA